MRTKMVYLKLDDIKEGRKLKKMENLLMSFGISLWI
jgi:hypothetical protein